MKRWMIFAVIAGLVVVAGLAVAVSAVSAQRPSQPGSGPMGMGGGMMGGMMGQGQGMGLLHEYMEKAMAAKLDMTVEELEAAHDSGKTFWALAEEKGLSAEDAQKLMVEARSEAIDAAIADGVITAEQGEWMKTRMNGMTPGGCGMQGAQGGTQTGTPGGMMRGRGMMRGGYGANGTAGAGK